MPHISPRSFLERYEGNALQVAETLLEHYKSVRVRRRFPVEPYRQNRLLAFLSARACIGHKSLRICDRCRLGISARLSLVQNLECFAHPGFVRYIRVGRLLAFRSLAIPFPNKVRLGNALHRFQSELFTPFLEIHKI